MKAFTVKARVTKRTPTVGRISGGRTEWDVDVIWSHKTRKIDRPCSFGWVVDTERDARRLEAAVNAGKAVTHPQIIRDDEGKTFVDVEVHVWGKWLDADLKKLGF